MPTGYTADVGDGKVTDFAKFAMQCARNFGALILMRDDPMDTPVPEKFEPSDYNLLRLEEQRRRLIEFEAMTPEEATRQCRSEHQKEMESWQERKERRTLKRQRYEQMLSKVRSWQCPPDHVNLKDFMIDQLMESIKWDCDDTYDLPSKPLDVDTWRGMRIAAIRKDIEYHQEQYAKEVQRTNDRNEWVRQLRESLK